MENIGIIILTASAAIFGVIFLIVGAVVKKDSKSFAKDNIKTEGVIIGYKSEDNSRWDTPQISFVNNEGKNIMSLVQSPKMTRMDIPVGTKVRIAYTKTIALGTDFYEVRILDEGNKASDKSGLGNAMYVLGAAFLIVAAFINIVRLI